MILGAKDHHPTFGKQKIRTTGLETKLEDNNYLDICFVIGFSFCLLGFMYWYTYLLYQKNLKQFSKT